jgi:hypothetical protein
MVTGQWKTETYSASGQYIPVIGQPDLTAGWQEDGYLEDPGKYVSDHPRAQAPGLVAPGPDWPWQ